jgi:hypothetical protein
LYRVLAEKQGGILKGNKGRSKPGVKVSLEQSPKSQPLAKHSGIQGGNNEASVRESTFQRRKGLLDANWANVFVSACAFFVSVLALGVAVDAGRATREHNRLSVRPHISLSFNANDKGAGWVRTISGAGPAIINTFEVTVDGKPVQTWDTVLMAFGINLQGLTGKLEIPTPGIYMPSTDATRPLLWVESPPTARAALVKNAERVQIKLVYCSLYDECWERTSSSVPLEPTPVPKRTPTLAFGISQAWRDGFSRDQ